MANAYFEEGNLISYKETDTKIKDSGTYVRFKPSKKVFKNMTENFSYERICQEIKNISYLNKGVHFIIKNDITNEEVEYYSENGIADFIVENATNPLMSKPFFASAKDEEDELEIAFLWTKGESKTYTFVNGLSVPEGGSCITGAKQKITTKMKNLSGKNLNPEIIHKGLVYVINCKVANPSFANQTKSKINNANLRILAAEAFEKALNEFSLSPDFGIVIETMKKLDEAEKAANEAREAILNHDKEMNEIKKNKLAFIEKLSDAEELGEDAVLCVVEGDSAGSSVALGRDTKKYGILRIKGKMLNTLKANDSDIYENEEIKMLLYALGINIHTYNPEKLRYGKLAILVDADDDGFHIALLIMANLYRLCPQFLQENRLYWLRCPLFIETDKNNNPISWYYTNKEFDEKRDILKGNIKRIKGLGALNEKDLKATLFSTTGGQVMDKITYSQEGINRLCELMGTGVEPRKEFIMNKIDFSTFGD